MGLQNWWVSSQRTIGRGVDWRTSWKSYGKQGRLIGRRGVAGHARTEDNVSSVEVRKGNHRHIVPYVRFPEKSAYRSRPCCALSMMTVWNAWRSDLRKSSLNQIELFACNAPKSCCKCSQMTKWTLSGSPMGKFSRCLHRGIRKVTVCTFRQASRRSRSWLSVRCVREQRSVGWWWCRSMSQSLASQIWFLLTQGWRLMVPIIGMFCCHRNYCPWCVKCRESSLSFSRTM